MRKLFSLKTLLILACVFTVAGASAQGIKDVRINEVLVVNTDSAIDDYGHRVGWIELFNTGYSSVDVGGAYLEAGGVKYRIPKNDRRTVMPPQEYLVFWAEGTASKGTFHTNFRLEQSDYVALYDQSGRNEIDRITYNIADQSENVAIGWYEDHDGREVWGRLDVVTPNASNNTIDRTPRHETMRQEDPVGGKMAMIAMLVVFTVLLLLFLVFKMVGNIFTSLSSRKEAKAKAAKAPDNAKVAVAEPAAITGELSGEALAAIAIALYKYSEELHDIENTVLTINKVARAYSPWSSKIYGLRQTPNKK